MEPKGKAFPRGSLRATALPADWDGVYKLDTK